MFLKKKNIKFNWYLIDATDKILGRLSTKIALYLMGKHKYYYLPYLNLGDYVVVINVKKILVTGNKFNDKKYYSHSGYIGGLKVISFRDMLIKCPEKIIKHSVKGMLPKGSLGRSMLKKLKVYPGKDHKHISNKFILIS